MKRSLVLVLSLAAVQASVAQAQKRAAHAAQGTRGSQAAGLVQFNVSCTATARAEFDRGVTLLHHMTYPRARAVFERVATIDARCAMAHWGLAMTLFAWLAHRAGDAVTGVRLLQQAADLEVVTPKHAVTPAPTVPAYELLGDLLMLQQNPGAALAAYERALSLHPRRFNTPLGAARAARAAGHSTRARAHYRQLLVVGAHSSRAAVLAEARVGSSRSGAAGNVGGTPR